MGKVQKNVNTGDLVVQRAKLPGMLISKLHDAVSAWEAGRSEELAALMNKITDLGVAWEQLQSATDADTVLVFPGVGAHLSQESDLGKTLIGLKTAVETRNVEEFKSAVEGITTQFAGMGEAENSATESDGQEDKPDGSENTENPEEKEPEQKEDPAAPPPAESTNTELNPTNPPPADSAPTSSPESSTSSVEKQSQKWGFDLAAEVVQEKRKSAEAQAAKEKIELEKKAKSTQNKSVFSWDNVVGGIHQPK